MSEAALKRTPRALIDPAKSGPYFLALLVLALVSFWPSYLSKIGAQTAYTHLHAALAAIWMLMLIAQPILVRQRRRDLHRTIGRLSYALAPLIIVSMVLLANSRITGVTEAAFPRRTYFLYLQLSLVVVFGVCYLLAVLTRKDMAVHARFMIGTSFTLIDPILIRLLNWIHNNPGWNYQWLTFGITDFVVLALIWLERDSRRGRWVFPVMLAVFVAAQLPAVLGWTDGDAWQNFARWFQSLPLT